MDPSQPPSSPPLLRPFPSRIVQDTAGNCSSQLIGVVDAVTTCEAIVPKKLIEAEAHLGGIEQRQCALVFVFAVEIIESWLQGLHESVAQTHRSFKNQAGVEAEHTDANISIVLSIDPLIVKVVSYVLVLHGWLSLIFL